MNLLKFTAGSYYTICINNNCQFNILFLLKLIMGTEESKIPPIPSAEDYIKKIDKYNDINISFLHTEIFEDRYDIYVAILRPFFIYKINSLSPLNNLRPFEPMYYIPGEFLRSKQYRDLEQEFKLLNWQILCCYGLNNNGSCWRLEYITPKGYSIPIDKEIKNRENK